MRFHDNRFDGSRAGERAKTGWHDGAMRLLLLEDDHSIRLPLRLVLEDEGYQVEEFERAESALPRARAEDFTVMLVDLMLGGMDGTTFIHRVREQSDVPIVVISARSDTYDIVAALEAGADDYVTKPFEVREVTARLRALRRRGRVQTLDRQTPGGTQVALGAQIVLYPEAGQVRRGETPVHLTVTEFRLLCELTAASGRVLSRQQLLEKVWDRGYFGDERIVDVHIRRLRAKIEPDPGSPRIVVTVRGLGYRLDRG